MMKCLCTGKCVWKNASYILSEVYLLKPKDVIVNIDCHLYEKSVKYSSGHTVPMLVEYKGMSNYNICPKIMCTQVLKDLS